ncbi:GGDEF domain-containing protein [Sphingomonas sp. GM_Shp_1]|uniref:GGDEF domain-containing protein n=1 Tax=Sphingomonas sp. GM_Shp_1 TaxID=2937381 RepID=UPI00226B6A66
MTFRAPLAAVAARHSAQYRPMEGGWVAWLTAPLDPAEEPLRPELTDLLFGNRVSIFFAVACLGVVLLCYAVFLDVELAALLTALFAPAAILRYATIGARPGPSSLKALLLAGLFWAAMVGLLCGEGARTNNVLLTTLSGIICVAVSFGGAYNNAGAPRFAFIQTVLFIAPYTVFAAFSGVPGMRLFLIQLPFWIVGIFTLIRQIYATHVKLIRARHLASHLALHDSLTGLPNRAHFMEALSAECQRASRDSTNHSYILYLDLDGFKPVNDTYGHLTGDDLLRAVADRFCKVVRGQDVIGRLGGDEFAAILRGVSQKEAEQIGEKLIAAARDPFHLDGHPPISIGVSIGGVALGLPPDVRRTLHAADTMLYAAKRGGKGLLRIAEAA